MSAPRLPDAILGHAALVARFGRWPDFHDAEVLSMRLERGPLAALTLPDCTVALRPIGEPSAPDVDCIVTLRFREVVRLRVAEFGHQNPILGLDIAARDAAVGPGGSIIGRYDVEFVGVHPQAFCASFACHGIEVVSIEPPPPA